jgi:8-oxo-dGTP pyrophosphatase MutT (NUDIX family)
MRNQFFFMQTKPKLIITDLIPEMIVGGILVNLDHEILLTIQPKLGREYYSCFVGGHVEQKKIKSGDFREPLYFQESLDYALFREIEEEVHLIPTSYEYIGHGESLIPSNSKQPAHDRIYFNYLCQVNSTKFDELELGEEIEKAIWFPPEKAEEMVFPHQALLIRELLRTGKLTEQPSGERPAVGVGA